MRKRQKKVKKRTMEPMESSALCILCGHLNSWEGEGKTRGSLLSSLKSWGNEEERARDLLEEFGRQLQFGRNHHNREGEGDDDEQGGDGEGVMIDLMEVLWDKEGSKSYSWTLCWDCAPGIKRAVEERRRCLKVEERVTKLQQRLLEELGKLKEGMGKFYLELKGVKGMMMNCRGGGGGRRGDFAVVEGGHSTADSLRRRILGAITELHAYQSDMSSKLVPVTPSSTTDTEVKMESEDAVVKDESESDDDPASPALGFDSDVEMECQGSGEVGEGPGVELGSNPSTSMKGFQAIANEIIARRQDTLMADLTANQQKPYITVITEYDSNSGAGAPDATDKEESDPESSTSHEDVDEDEANLVNSDSGGQGGSDNIGSEPESDGDWRPSSSKKGKPSNSNNSLAFSKASTLKEMFTLRAVRRQRGGQRQRQSPAPTKERFDFHDVIRDMNFSKALGKLTIGEVELTFDEELKLVQCGSCPFQATWSEALSSSKRKLTGNYHIAGELIRAISDHIHSVHLDAFKCPTCGVRKATQRLYQVHMSRSHLGTFPCDICGRPLKKQEYLVKHRWCHMNESEKEEARLKGGKDPRTTELRFRERQANLIFSCDICQKRFKSKASLKSHKERGHLEEKDLVICPVCGKSMLKQSYDDYHKRFSCPLDATGGEHFEMKCIHCPAILKNRKGFRVHMARHHSTQAAERPHLCFLCGMSFKTKVEVKLHMETHETERLWKCSRGCGKDFNVQRYRTRHEANCKYSAEGKGGAGEQMDGSVQE